MTERQSAELRSRTLVFAAILACAFIGLLARLAHLQIVKHDEYSRLAANQQGKTIPLRARRGPIVDRNGQVLAVSTGTESLYAIGTRVEDRAALAARLAPTLGEPAREIEKRIDPSRRFVFIKRRLPPDVVEAVRDLKEPTLGFVEESLRLYPNRELAAQTVGFEGLDGRGLGGVEQSWDAQLGGVDGKALVGRDALGREVTGAPTVLKPSVPGQGVMLTIDATLQYIAEREVEASWQRTRAKAAMAVLMDPRTGEILAIAVRPTFNPNSFAAATDEERRNRAVTDPFEPGSTFKVILAAAALEEKVVRPSDRIYAENGAITVASATIHDWKRYGWLTFAEVLQNSSNVGAIKVGLMLGKERYYKYISGFGFGAVSGIGLAGESRGQLRAPAQWSGLSLATMSIGQEISVTAVQMVSAFAAVANGGRLMQPQIVRAVLDSEGRAVTRAFEPRVIRQVISPETAQVLTQIMIGVVREGTGHNAAIPGYEVAGKTGTAQKLDRATRRYSRAPGVLSFIGFVPADDPRLAMLVMLDEPKNEKWGSEAAAPIFAAIGRDALRYLNVPPRDTTPVPIVRGEIASASPVSRLTKPASFEVIEDTVPAMPRVEGLSLRQAMAVLAPFDIALEINGQGLVRSQSPVAGSPLTPGSLCRLTLASPIARSGVSP
ncbi:MAG: penicillin-binding protein [Candidatus Rokuibacteriota bacterium]|nr:MAG: penicillin-binding protein [Candidatus Rokubacteria bacterium]